MHLRFLSPRTADSITIENAIRTLLTKIRAIINTGVGLLFSICNKIVGPQQFASRQPLRRCLLAFEYDQPRDCLPMLRLVSSTHTYDIQTAVSLEEWKRFRFS